MLNGKLLMQWLKARRTAFLYTAAVFGLFFFIYGLFGYEWGTAGYAAVLGAVLGAVIGVWDLIRFAARSESLEQMAGRFPTGNLPEPRYSLESNYHEVIAALEAERVRLEKENEHVRRDAEEYYTLWAHQIKTPIAAMKLLLQSGGSLGGRGSSGRIENSGGEGLAARENSGGGERFDSEVGEALEQELFRVEQYVDMVLQYQRLSSIESDLSFKTFDVLALVKTAARNCSRLFIYKGMALETENVTGRIITDGKWFCFVLEQLFSNAVKYSAGGAVRVYSRDNGTAAGHGNSAAAENKENLKGTALVIEDNGISIPPEDLPRVFEWGFTGAVGRTERSSTGIGLYLCRRIMTRLGFGITIESEAGKGTRAVLHLAQKNLEMD